ncbi:MAG: CatB-related O-acetyltransferase [Oscillospiraceae bacterium]|nr:CatB-related O-acetyltransferase [Oscillospiraceae bacterium]
MSKLKKIAKRLLLYKRVKKTKSRIVSLMHMEDVEIEGHNSIGANCRFNSVRMGMYSYVAGECFFSHTRIGRFCSIGSNVRIATGAHPTSSFVSTHPVFYDVDTAVGKGFVKNNKFEEYKYTDKSKKVLLDIGNDVWVASNALFVDGITVGDGAVIAAGSIVTHDVPPYAVVAGVPARVIKYRFTDDDIDFLQKLKWWDQPLEWIQEHAELFSNVDDLREVVEYDGEKRV